MCHEDSKTTPVVLTQPFYIRVTWMAENLHRQIIFIAMSAFQQEVC